MFIDRCDTRQNSLPRGCGAGVSRNEHRALGSCNEFGPPDHFRHRPAASSDAVVVELRVAFADEILPLGLQTQTLHHAPCEREELVDLERLFEEVLDSETSKWKGCSLRCRWASRMVVVSTTSWPSPRSAPPSHSVVSLSSASRIEP